MGICRTETSIPHLRQPQPTDEGRGTSTFRSTTRNPKGKRQKAKGKGQKAKGKRTLVAIRGALAIPVFGGLQTSLRVSTHRRGTFVFCLLPFAFCLLPLGFLLRLYTMSKCPCTSLQTLVYGCASRATEEPP